jgi:hypothetical protein
MITLPLTNAQAAALTLALDGMRQYQGTILNPMLNSMYVVLEAQKRQESLRCKLPNYKSDVADYDLEYRRETRDGLCVRVDEDSEDFWLPKSKVQYENKNYRRGDPITVTIPEWLVTKHDIPQSSIR